MNKKALNHLIFSLAAALASLIFSTLSIVLIKADQVIYRAGLSLLSAIADGLIFINLYIMIRTFFNKQSNPIRIAAALGLLIMIPIWFGFRAYVFEGAFEINRSINSLYVAYFSNVMSKVIDQTVTYFSVTLFSQEAVLEYFVLFVFSLLTDLVTYLIIPMLPLILMFRDVMNGNEEYQFSQQEAESKDAEL